MKTGSIQTGPGTFPGPVSDEILAQIAIDGCKQIAHVLPELRELRARFAQIYVSKSARTIAGCATWHQFCRERLDRSPSAIRKALAPDKKEKSTAAPDPFRAVWKQVNVLRHYSGDGEEHKFVSNMANILQAEMSNTQREESRLILSALRQIIADFTVYADRLEDRIRVAGVA